MPLAGRAPVGWSGLAMLVILLSACSVGSNATVTPRDVHSGLEQASIGMCKALAALPDPAAARRAFANEAHDALHALAADPRLDRSASARILEAMQKVESDFSASTDRSILGSDLATLSAAAEDALRTIGEDVPRCGQ